MNMNKQAGFTLIEIIAVIVIIGILSAVALPKFVNLGGEARVAKMQGAVGAVNSAAVLIHSKWLAQGSPATGTVAFEGGSLSAVPADGDIVNGYPSATRIAEVAGLGATDFDMPAAAAGVLTVRADGSHTSCSFTYTQSAAAGAAPTTDTTNLTSANCQ